MRKPQIFTGRASKPARSSQPVRYAVVGLGYIAQSAMLPAFEHAAKNSKLVALVSNDPTKLKKVGRMYGVKRTYKYDQFDECLASGEIDAVYIALPNNMHRDFAIRAANAGVHVLCEKPMLVTEEECREMIEAADQNDIKLMIAYRLHFEQANLDAIEIARSGKLGDLRLFNSVFCMQVKEGDIRLQREMGGGTLYDIGIYCINAARYLFRDEPVEVLARSIRSRDPRFKEIDEATSAILKFPGERLASFMTSFGASDTAFYRIVGTKGQILMDQAFEYATEMKRTVLTNGKPQEKTYSPRDQFSAELLYFSECVQKNKDPEPSGYEGLADVRIIEALYRSAQSGRPEHIQPVKKAQRPTKKQAISRPKVTEPDLVHAEAPSK